MRIKKKLKRKGEFWLIRSIAAIARMLPHSVGHRVFSALGALAGRILNRDRRRAEANLAGAFPAVPSLVRQAMVDAVFKNLGRSVYEFLTLEGSSQARILERVERVEGMDHFQRAYGQGRGVVVVTAHIGCWEVMPAYFAARGYALAVVGRRMRIEQLDRRLTDIRASLGVRTIDRDSGPRRMVEALKSGACLGLLLDQHINAAPGVYVPFFGRPALTPTVAAKLAMMTGAPILPMGIYLNRQGRHVVHVLPPVVVPEGGSRDDVVRELTARCSSAIENLVRIDPKQWVWFHHRWRAPEETGRAYAVQN